MLTSVLSKICSYVTFEKEKTEINSCSPAQPLLALL